MQVRLRLIRHATVVLDWDDLSLLVDPMLAPAGAMDPVPMTSDTRRIPLGELPLDDAGLRALIAGVDAVLVTHHHRDHWDTAASELIPASTPLLTQPASEEKLRSDGFTDVTTIADRLDWRGLAIARTGGQHGTGEIGQLMGAVSGFVFRRSGAPIVYLAGDTIWCPEVEQALAEHQPDVVIVNAGAAQFDQGDPITMSASDIAAVCAAAPRARVVAVHLDQINHCHETRDRLAARLEELGVRARVTIPADGETVALA